MKSTPGKVIVTLLILFTIVDASTERETKKTCDDVHCQNGGVCSIRRQKPLCKCLVNFKGRYCETLVDADPCTRYTCYNGGHCVFTNSGPICKCAEGFRGKRCDRYVSRHPCDEHKCDHDEICYVRRGRPYCTSEEPVKKPRPQRRH
ncbi:unnamed protein product [Lymnaea stagnalis]|uniref:EGF-like domain-containing protein n=1 Tax=Lymnaea stagnalis TaxID=6523 RepID=A0AAV2IB18_LYMST